jgi:hypothetical protein
MILPILCPGHGERFKGLYHRTLMLLLAGAGLYNGCAYLARGSTHSGVNAVAYGLLVYWEQQHVKHHAKDCK